MSSVLGRRSLLQGAIAFSVGTSIGVFPQMSEADSICRICRLSKLHPGRLAAGLIFNTVRSMVIEGATTSIFQSLTASRGRRYMPRYIPINEYHKGALAYAGESDYDLYFDNRIISILKNQEQREKLEEMKAFLRNQNIMIKSAYTSISYPVNNKTTLDDMLSIEYFTNVEGNSFLDRMVMMSSTSAVEEWLIS